VVQVLPPSDVVATDEPFVFRTAQHSVVVGHEMPVGLLLPLGAVWLVHSAPPSVVARTSAWLTFFSCAVAKQTEVEGHETSLTEKSPAGRVWLVHVVPPSVVAIMSEPPTEEPTAQQFEVVGQSMARRYAIPGGMAWGTHELPPSALAITTTAPSPARLVAQQWRAVGHETAVNGGTPAERL